jgi:photosystem II stability/assembly factor-like uncharacterized protein
MKKILLFCFVAFISFYSFAQEYTAWKWLHEKPQGNTLRWVKMFDANNWYAVGLDGTFMKTSDGGASWYLHHKAGLIAADGGGSTLYTANFTSMTNGIVIGTGGVAYTTDGGETFQPIANQLPSAATWYESYFLNDTIGYLAGTTSGRLARTTDGGMNWTLNTIIASGTFYDVWSPDDTLILVATTSGNIRRSTDGGLTFSVVNVGHTATNYNFAFKDASRGWVVGSTGKASYTTDGGLTWTNKSVGLPTGTTFYDVDYRMNGSVEEVVLTGDAFDLYSTTDDGTTWTTIEFLAPYADQPWTGTYYATEFLGDKFVTVGSFGLVNSRTGTATPAIHSVFRKPGILYDIWGENGSGKIIAVGAPGNSTSFDQIFYSTDGGVSWSKGGLNKITGDGQVQYAQEVNDDEYSDMLTPASTSTFRSIDMVTSNVGYICGSNSAVYKTTNGGQTWDSLTTPMTALVILYDIDFVDENTGWFVGASGNLYNTTDGGATWVQQTPGLTGTIYSISMVDNLTGWLAATGGYVAKTTDGGATWNAQVSGFGTSAVYNVKMLNAQTGYISGASSKFAKTTDGGATWTLIPLPAEFGTATTLYALDFLNESYGIVGGSSARTAATTDGGLTWVVDNSASGTIWGLRIAGGSSDTTSVYITGTNSSILVDRNFVVPVELTSFKADVVPEGIQLSWTTATEKNNNGFAVERRTDASSFEQIAFVSGNGTTLERNEYTYIDSKVSAGKYIYRLKQTDYDGTYSYSGEVEVNIELPSVFTLDQNYPNPFNPVTMIKYSLPTNVFVSLSVYNSLGEKVGTLVNSIQDAGNYEVSFDASGLSSGIYFYKLEAGAFTSSKKMILLK